MVGIITAAIYALITLYLIYMAMIHIFVYVANTGMGHQESAKVPIRYALGALFGMAVSFIGYKYYKSGELSLILKIIFYTPISLTLLYILWAVLLLISSGGKWN